MKYKKMISLMLALGISMCFVGCGAPQTNESQESSVLLDNQHTDEGLLNSAITESEVVEDVVVSISEIAMNYEPYDNHKITVFGRSSEQSLKEGNLIIMDSDYNFDGYPNFCACNIEESELAAFQDYFKTHGDKERDIYGDVDIAVSGICTVEKDEEWDRVKNITLEKCEVIERNALTGDEGKEIWKQFQKVLFPSVYNNYYKIGEVLEQSFSSYSMSKTIYEKNSMSGGIYSILIEGTLISVNGVGGEKVQMRWEYDANTNSVMVDEYYGESMQVYEQICYIARIG